MTTGKKKGKISLLKILFSLYAIIVLILTFFGPEPPRRHHSSARPKACHSNCRVILGGIEMYDMDHKDSYDSTEIPLDPSKCDLNGYYKPITKPDSECFYWYDVESKEVYCAYHGSPSHPWDWNNGPHKFGPDNIPSYEELKKINEEEVKQTKNTHIKDSINKYIRDLPERFILALVTPLYYGIIIPLAALHIIR